jgi:hypothetical protein
MGIMKARIVIKEPEKIVNVNVDVMLRHAGVPLEDWDKASIAEKATLIERYLGITAMSEWQLIEFGDHL